MNFDNKALNWDNEMRINRAKIIADEIIKSVDLKKNCCAMEFGCGTGLISFNIQSKFDHITLIDSSKGMIDTLKSKIETHKISNMTAIETDITTEASLKGKYDVIYTSMALHHIQDVESTLEKLFNFLNEGGYLCIVDLTEDDGSFHKLELDFDGHNGFNQEALKELLSKIGYRQVDQHIIYNGEKIIEDRNVKYSLFIMTGRRF